LSVSDAAFVLPVDKPSGPTSHDVVARARRALGTRRIGHTGTLDPFASGLLLLCVNGATRIAEYLTVLPKTYVATARLDGRTLTDDNTVNRMETSEAWRSLSADQIAAALQQQVGDILQLPPQYSAKKIAGERAYEIARRGAVAELEAARVHVHGIRLVRVDLPAIDFEVQCSSGTYIRAMARDLGEALGTGGYLTQLRRTRIGPHDVSSAVTLDELGDPEQVSASAITPLAALAHLHTVTLTEADERAIRFGQSIARDSEGRAPVALVRNDRLIAIARAEGARLKPQKVFADA
jgi:tRNA pseudouridine55 synthase